MAAEFLAAHRNRHDGHLTQGQHGLGHGRVLVEDPLGPQQVRDCARAASRGEAGSIPDKQVRGQAGEFTASVVPAPHMLTPTTPKRERQLSPGAVRCVPAGTAHSRGSSLTAQSMVRETTLATAFPDQKTLVHMIHSP